MDRLTADLLRTWGLQEYIKHFLDGRVDSGTLRILTDDEIGQLIPIPGDRARFKINLNNWKSELAGITHSGPEIDSSFGLREAPELPTLLRSAIDIDFMSTSPSSVHSDHITSTPISKKKNFYNLDNYTKPSATVTSQTEPLSDSNTSIADIGTLEPQSSSTEERYAKRYEYRQQELGNSNGSSETVQHGYVLKTLKSSIDGRAILSKRESGKLEETQRNILVKLLLQPIFEENPNAHITNKQLLSWSLEIQEIFIKESAALYYTPYVSALVQTTARNASGKLLRHVYNKRQQLRNRGIIERTRSRSPARASSSSASSNSDVAPLIRLPAVSVESNEEIREKLSWLRNSLEPWQLVEEKWAATAAVRLNTNYLAGSSLQEYFNEYPVLKSPTGYQLLLGDFQAMYSEKTDALFTSVVVLKEKILEVAKNKFDNIRDKDIKQTMQDYLNAINDAEGPDAKNNGALMLLPYITSSVPLKEKKKILWRPSKSEVRDGLVSKIGADSELETTVANRKSKLERYGKTLQPFVIFVGPSIAEISHCYVVAGDTYYKINKLIHAIDTCFKIIHATGAKYQSEAYVVWMVIQKAFYKIVTPYDKDLITVKSLLIDLGI